LTALFALFELTALSALFALAWRFEPTMVVVLLVLMLMLLAIRLEAIDWVCSRDSSTSNSQQTTHHNPSLTATNINLNTTQDTKIKGANLQATTQLNREDVKVLTVYVDLSVICVVCIDCVICVI
jgi:nucleoside recognition membrane protein YjiH